LTPYDLWELHEVIDHLLIVPKRHAINTKDLTERERLAIMDIISDYESNGYNVYTRGVGSATRSVDHYHTHLIKTGHKKPRLAFYLRKPYLLVKL
jgi:hypothetical protein